MRVGELTAERAASAPLPAASAAAAYSYNLIVELCPAANDSECVTVCLPTTLERKRDKARVS